MKKFAILFSAFFIFFNFARANFDKLNSQKINFGDSFFAVDENISKNEKTAGDGFFAAKNLKILGEISEDFWGISENLEIAAPILDDARAVAKNLKIDSAISGDAFLVAENLEISQSAQIFGSAFILAKNIKIAGEISQNATIAAANLEFKNPARVGGNLKLRGEDFDLKKLENFVDGTIFFEKKPLPFFEKFYEFQKFEAQKEKFEFLPKFLFALFFAIFAISLLPNFIVDFAKTAKKGLPQNLVRGVLFLILTPLLALLLFATILGIPLALLTLLFYAAYLIFAKFFGAFFIGHLILPISKSSKTSRFFASFMVGEVAILFASQIPILGDVFCFLLFVVTVGALFYSDLNFWKFLRQKLKTRVKTK